MTPSRSVLLSVLFLAFLLLGGCSQEQVDRAQWIVADSRAILERAVAAEKLAIQAVERAEALAVQIGDARASAVVEQARAALTQVSSGVEVAREAVTRAEDAATAAAKAHEAGGGTMAVIGAAILAGLGGWSGAAALARRAVSKYAKALELTAVHADRMESAETEGDVRAAKQVALVEQSAAGVHALIQKVRG